MNNRDALRILEFQKDHIEHEYMPEFNEAYDLAIKAVQRRIETKVHVVKCKRLFRDNIYACPNCGYGILEPEQCCPTCGQALDWSEVKRWRYS